MPVATFYDAPDRNGRRVMTHRDKCDCDYCSCRAHRATRDASPRPADTDGSRFARTADEICHLIDRDIERIRERRAADRHEERPRTRDSRSPINPPLTGYVQINAPRPADPNARPVTPFPQSLAVKESYVRYYTPVENFASENAHRQALCDLNAYNRKIWGQK